MNRTGILNAIAKPSDILRDVADLIIQGNSLPSIHDYIASRGHNPQETIADAHQYFATVACRTKPETIIGIVMEGYRDIYRQALTVGDLPTARGCLKDLQSLALKIAEYEFDDHAPEQPKPKRQRKGKIG